MPTPDPLPADAESVRVAETTVRYQVVGPPDGRPVVFVHGYLMASSLWSPLATRLAGDGFRCFMPTWPLGAHSDPVARPATLTMEGIAALVAGFLEHLELDDTILVGTDTGGAVSQIVAVEHPTRIGSLVLTSCDAFEHFPPPILKPLIAAAKAPMPSVFRLALQPLRTAAGRRRSFAALSHNDIEPLVAEWILPATGDSRIADDLRHFTASLDQRSTLHAASRLPEFDRPALIAWSQDDAFFPLDDGRRLAEALPQGRLEILSHSRTFSMIDQPDRLAQLIVTVAGHA